MPIVKVERDGDSRRVFGLVTNDDIDSDDQIVDSDFARKAMATWFQTAANVRQMHSTQLAPAGKGIRLEDTPKGQYVEALVVEPTAVKLVDAGVYGGYSVGISHPRIVRDNKARGGRIVSGDIVEISLVDRPANYSAKFALCKMAGGDVEYIGKAVILDADESNPIPDPRRTVKRIREGAHVTIHARDEYGELTAYEGIVTKRLSTSVALDCTRYSRDKGVIILDDDDIEAAYKGSYPIEAAKSASGPAVTDDVLTKLSLRIKNDSTGDITAAMRRVSQWALTGTSALSDTDLERVYSAYAAEFSGRNPNKRVESFPATSIGKGRIANVASLDELVDEVLKYNDNHDENGRFASGDGGGGQSSRGQASSNRADSGMTETQRAMGSSLADLKPGQTSRPPQGAALSSIRAWDHAQSQAYTDAAANASNRPYALGPEQMAHPGGDQVGVHRDATSQMSNPPGNVVNKPVVAGPVRDKEPRNLDNATQDPEGFGDPTKDPQRSSADTRTTPMFGTSDDNSRFGPNGGVNIGMNAATGRMMTGHVTDGQVIGDREVSYTKPPFGKSDEPDTIKTTTEASDSLGNETTIQTPEATKAACEKCKGTGMFEGSKCDKCSVKSATVTKQVAQAHAAAADAHAAAADATDDPKDAANHADAADEAAEAAEEAEETEAEEAQEEADAEDDPKAKKGAKGFGSKKAPPFGKKPKTAPAADAPADAEADDADEIPYAVRKAHDWTCAAYKSDDLLDAYPTVEENGITTALGEKVKKSLVKAIRQSEDAREIAAIGKVLSAYADLNDETDDLMPARDEMNVAFKAENPTLSDYPKPSESITPGQFKRPLITAGHAQNSATAHAPRIPTTTHPIGPEDFTRGPLTEGHARVSKMMDFHDAISAWKPELCRMDSSGSNAFDRQPPSSFQRPPFTNEVPNRDSASPTAVSAAAIASATKNVDLTVQTPTDAKSYTSEELDAALSKAVAPLLTKINRMENEYEELAASPDPNRSAFRGVAGTGMNKITAPDAKKAAHKAARKAKRDGKIENYRLLAEHSDPSIRTHAMDRLAKMGKEY